MNTLLLVLLLSLLFRGTIKSVLFNFDVFGSGSSLGMGVCRSNLGGWVFCVWGVVLCSVCVCVLFLTSLYVCICFFSGGRVKCTIAVGFCRSVKMFGSHTVLAYFGSCCVLYLLCHTRPLLSASRQVAGHCWSSTLIILYVGVCGCVYVSVCVCAVCVCVCVCAGECVCMWVWVHMYAGMYMYVCIFVSECMWPFVCMHMFVFNAAVHVYVCVWLCVCVCVCACMFEVV